MAEKYLKVGQRVELTGKDVRGTIAYVGMTSFAVGKWVGVILDEAKGKNNGSIKGHQYFSCEENYGMFVRPTQLMFIDDAGNPIEEAQTPDEKPRSRLSSAGSVRSLASMPGSTQTFTAKPTAVRRKSPVKQPQTKRASMTMTLSTSSSRMSLNRSTSSLGSKTQLTSPGSERASGQSSIPTPVSSIPTMVKPDRHEPLQRSHMSPPESLQTSKRASFVETGFVETLKPQFTPGQSLISPSPAPTPAPGSSTEDRIHILQLQQELDEMRKLNGDLSEKLETLKQRRAEDRERLREFDKLKTQYEQLVEFKSKIMDAHSLLQRDLQRAKQEAKDAIEARDLHSEEMSELAENVELITLDKEMAEEKADTLALELETAKERIEELTLDLEILKTEMQEKLGSRGTAGSGGVGTGGDGPTAVASTYEFKQLEQQNARLRETLVRLRDLSAHEKHEIQKLEKELETKKSEVTELQRTKEKFSAKIDELETQLSDLQEQVDAALGAEEMVEQLAEKKMELEDKVKSLEEEVAELEALEEVHEQLVESNHELEMDMREELDLAHAAKREAIREKDAALETIVDRDQTILKFRELVQRLNDQCQELRERLNQESTKQQQQQQAKDTALITETIDFKQMFAESKAFTRAIDLQLRQIELTQANEHVRYLSAFMPDVFMARGGDHDAILVILLVSRIVFKSGIIVSQARERFSNVPQMDRAAILSGHEVAQFGFRSRLLHHVHNLQSIMHQFLFSMTGCKADTLLKIGAALPEMQAQEKMVDEIVDMLKANQLDENSSTDNLEKCVTFFNAMYVVLLTGEDLVNETQIVRDCTASIGAACDSIANDSNIIKILIKPGDETSDSGLLLQYILQNVENIRQQLKLVKRRLPQDVAITKCNLSMNTLLNLKRTAEALNKVMSVLFYATRQCLQLVTLDPETETSVPHDKLWEILSNGCEKVYEQDDLGPSQNVRTVLSAASTDMGQLAQYLLDHEYEIISATNTAKPEEKPVAPIILRAQAVKKQLEETKTLTATLENREAEIRQLKLAAKLKQNELSEMQIRKDLAEKKLSVLQQDHETNTTRLQKQYDEVCAKLKQKEKEFEETMDHLQSDIDSLESEKSSLRDKLKSFSSRKVDLKTTTALDISASSPYIAQELSLLKRAFKDERTERLKVQANEYRKILAGLEPLHVPQPKDDRIQELEQEITRVKHDLIMSLVKGAEIPSTYTVHGSVSKSILDHENQQKQHQTQIRAKAEQLACDVVQEYLSRKPHRAAKADFASFPSNELSAAFRVNVRV
ncbi:dynactin subunit 1 isoform X2 [Anopheles maculipalpis]|uniref:dynactin subunit 1 isoform X2 n=1 Tax=Anopheles maculipalpis TaxID=1496333 RepID=UPI002159AA14|nr:dynactin subunit 1 isoform X2 [Anopheles maculipalpis]